ncbi:DUF4249 family protein [Flavobacterium aquicola]|uniref:Uncharacterized protein DUF4249 n=1 Tax=Flavobacterium aquicola TaxID=1682742 RepID=A0A3E0EUT9_9FLAO|nr:DUF4249 family protein [Flavobacterium aquicola]REH01962.1 uncharacterized protein DUF4249 [Flavobacterium aquicola]
MKSIKYYILLLIVSLGITSCEEVVDVDLDTAPPKLVIDASIKWEKGTTGEVQKIVLTTTTDFYSNTIPVATGATIVVTNTTPSTPIPFQFIENGQTGEYVCSNFIPIINNQYSLTITYKGQTYSSSSKLMPTPVIASTEQSVKPGIDGKDSYEIKFYWQDNGAEDNFYLVGAKNANIVYPEYGVLSDEFFQGNSMFALYRDDELEKGDVIQFSIQGITEQYSNYMNKLLNIAGSDGGNPFATPPATLRGNIFNQTNSDNYPLGFFHLSEIDSDSYTIQ